MTWSGFAGWTFGPLIADTLAEAQALCQVDDLSFIGSSANAIAAAILNRVVARYLNANPTIGLATANQTLTASTNGYNIPADLRQFDILKIWYPNSGSDPFNDLRELSYDPKGRVSAIDPNFRNGSITADNPDSWTISDDGSQIILMPMPNSSTVSVKIGYRPRATVYTSLNISSPGSTAIAEIPVVHQDVIADGLTYWFARLIPKTPDLIEMFRLRFDNPDWNANGQPKGGIQRSQDELADTMAMWTGSGQALNPNTPILATEMVASQFARLGDTDKSSWIC